MDHDIKYVVEHNPFLEFTVLFLFFSNESHTLHLHPYLQFQHSNFKSQFNIAVEKIKFSNIGQIIFSAQCMERWKNNRVVPDFKHLLQDLA